MKTNLFVMMTAMLLGLSSCSVNLGNGFSEKIEPSDNIVRAKYQQDAFDEVNIHVVGNIRLVQSKDGKSRVTLSAPENYIEYFVFKNEDGELDINYSKANVSIESDDIDIIVYTPTLNKIKNAGAASVRMDSLTTEELEIKNSGVGAFNITEVNAKKVDVECSGVGSITITGQADEGEYSCSGVGSIDAKDLKAKEVDASVSGVGGIECFASDYIKGSVSGVGGLKYAGHPAKKDLHNGLTGGISEL